MQDETATGTDPLATLVQGLGPVSFASPDTQAKQDVIVVAPLYPNQPVTSGFTMTSAMPAMVNLIKALSTQYSVDTKRIYSTGQSGGAMLLAIAMDIAYPDFFAASWIVAGQWDPAKVAPMAMKKLRSIVAEGDAEA